MYAGHEGGRTYAMVDAVKRGIAAAGEDVELRALPALRAGIDDLLWADALLIGTPEHFGYMAGAIKDFFDRTFYPAQSRVEGLPYAIFVNAGNDGTGASIIASTLLSAARSLLQAERLSAAPYQLPLSLSNIAPPRTGQSMSASCRSFR